jgi:hypothetical protein
VFGDIGKKKEELLEGIRELELIEECRCLEEDEKVRKGRYVERAGEDSYFLRK